MSKYRTPTKEEEEIIRRNGIDPEGKTVSFRSDTCIELLAFKTRDTITIRQGDKKW